MKAIHITEKANADKIKKEGFSLAFMGTKGGQQLGNGIYFSGSHSDCDYWEHRLSFNAPVRIEVELNNIIEAKNVKMAEMLKIATDRCWFENGTITEKAKTDLGIEIENFDAQVKTLAAEDMGYNGISFGEGSNIIVWNVNSIIIK